MIRPTCLRRSRTTALVLVLLFQPVRLARAEPVDPAAQRLERLYDMSLEQLLDQKIFLASRKEEAWFDTPAAVTVLDRGEIRRSGATSIPELLRRVPGVHVARVNAHTWAVSVRGFSRALSNKLLVQIDGRSVYSPLFAGAYWDIQQPVLEDIERIEIIRGPGASLWGANAVNGIINIVTRNAHDTQGVLASVSAGSEDQLSTSLRYGGAVGDSLYYRAYTNHLLRDDLVDADNDRGGDDWRFHQGGLRLDWEPGERDRVMAQGAYYKGEEQEVITGLTSLSPLSFETVTDDTKLEGGNLLLRWSHRIGDWSELVLRGYYDRTEQLRPVLEERRDTFDLDFQHRFRLTEHQEITWGLGYSRTRGETDPGFAVVFDPDSRSDALYSGFLQGDVSLLDERLRVQLGSKLEHNDFTGWEVQPSLRLGWQGSERYLLWAAASRAVRVPSVAEHDIQIDLFAGEGPTGPLFRSFGSRDAEPERVYAFELGTRVQLRDDALVDIALFYNLYDRLSTTIPGTPFFDPSIGLTVMPSVRSNESEGDARGVEMAARWEVTRDWHLMTSLSYLHLDLKRNREDASPSSTDGQSPSYMAFLGSRYRPIESVDLDLSLYFVDALPGFSVSSHLRLDARVGWRATPWLELSLMVRNALETHHEELATVGSVTAFEPERDFTGKATVWFDAL
jgi:iron complex outermembrane receptor protein